ncbi:MAG TPA: hypothetical protein VFP12_03410 [Allosphingosinicella sp.]|nr:hypothetical protein [Allosphingosinicella sp.]
MKFAPLVAVFLVVQSAASLACSPVYDPRPMEVQQDEWTRESYSKAQAMAEVVALQGSRRHGWGLVRVVRVLKGPIRPGRIFRLRTLDSGLCGAGHFRRGSRGLTLIDRIRGENVFHGYLPADYLTRLDRLGLRPLSKQ